MCLQLPPLRPPVPGIVMIHVAQKQTRLGLREYQADVIVDADGVKPFVLALSSLWNFILGWAGFICRSKAVVFTAFCSSPVRRTRLSVKVSAMRNCIRL